MNENDTKIRKNKTNLIINYPPNTEYFTVASLHAMNPDFIRITLTTHLNRDITEKNKVAVIGTLNNGKGRPQKIHAMRPVLPSVIEKAKQNDVLIEDESNLIPVMDITNKPTSVVNPINSNDLVSA